MKRRITFVLSLCFMLSVVFSPGFITAENNTEEVPEGKLNIWSWGAGREKEAREINVEIFKKKYPQIQVDHVVYPTADSVWDQKQTAAYAAGTAGDVMQMSPDYYGLLTNYYEDLMPYAERDNLDFEELMTPGILDGYILPNGKLEALPLLANTFVMAYNKNMFDEAGVDYPTEDWTWDDVLEMAPSFVGGEGFNQTYLLPRHWVLQNFGIVAKGGKPYADDFSTALVDTDEVKASLTLFHDLAQMRALPDDAANQSMPAEQMFVAGLAAMYPMGGFEIESVSKSIGENFEWDAIKMPRSSEDGPHPNITYATGYAMNTAAQDKEAAWLFLKEVSFANEDMARETMIVGMPANKNIAENEYTKLVFNNVSTELYLDSLVDSTMNPWGGALATAGDPYGLLWESVTLAGTSVEDAMAEYVPLVNQAFDELDIAFAE